MKRFLVAAAIAALVPTVVPLPASAHAQWSIAGFQFLAVDGPSAGPTGYLSVPTGAVFLPDGWSDDGFGGVTNRDPVPHTFTECTADCDLILGRSEGARFDVALAPGAAASGADATAINDLFESTVGIITIMCDVHPWMRARVELNA